MIIVADVTNLPLADRSVDLVLGSPPYCDARTYDDGTLPAGHTVSRDARAWVEWMLDVTTECLRVCRGAVIWVAAGVTRERNYWPACEGLMWEWFKRGGSAYRPCYWHRVGIPGSGGDQWYRADVEYVMCFKRPGALPFAEPKVNGHPPKWAPGGEMSYRLSDGRRVNQWGGSADQQFGERSKNGARRKRFRPSHREHTKRRASGEVEEQSYRVPDMANPGVLIQTGPVGGGHLGDRMTHENEAPFPERLPEFFIRSHCPPGGIVFDPFSGSGTTAKMAKALGRRFIASDLRLSQARLTRRRVASVQKLLV